MNVYEHGAEHPRTLLMFHCYPVFPICREAKEGWEQMARIMKE